MPVFRIETVQDVYTTYVVEASSSAEAEAKLQAAFRGQSEDSENILYTAYGTVFGDSEKIIDVSMDPED